MRINNGLGEGERKIKWRPRGGREKSNKKKWKTKQKTPVSWMSTSFHAYDIYGKH